MARWTGPRKYDPLTDYLARCRGERVMVTLAEIEALNGTPLPATARSAQFWGNYARAWPAPVWRLVV